jgi:cathepsin L
VSRHETAEAHLNVKKLRTSNMKTAVFALVFSLFCAVQANLFYHILFEEFEGFKLRHGKMYKDAREESFRLKIFADNKHRIAKHNKLFAQGLHNFSLAMNKYGDLLPQEFVSVMNGFKQSKLLQKKHVGITYLSPTNVNIPKEWDWRDHGYVTPVKDQGQCGSCWAFSATGSLEGQHYRKSKKMVSLSEQNLVDCSGKFGNEGCNGGLMDNAFQYVKENGGIDTEDSYPYDARDEDCHYNPKNSGATDSGYVDVASGNEKKLQEALATVGPISIAIDASQETFQFYSHGIYDEPHCSSTELDHGVLAVGYGTDKKGRDYWIVKNSWGESWGDKGYILMSRNKRNQCGVATQASYPLV